MRKSEPLSNEYKMKLVQEAIVEFLDIRYNWDNPNIREVWLLDFSQRVGRQIPAEDYDERQEENERVKKTQKIKKYLSLNK